MSNEERLAVSVFITNRHSEQFYSVIQRKTIYCSVIERNHTLQTSQVPFESQVQRTSLFMSAASNQRGCQRIVHGRLRFGCLRVRGGRLSVKVGVRGSGESR